MVKFLLIDYGRTSITNTTVIFQLLQSLAFGINLHAVAEKS